MGVRPYNMRAKTIWARILFVKPRIILVTPINVGVKRAILGV